MTSVKNPVYVHYLLIKNSIQKELRENMTNSGKKKKRGHREDQPVQLPKNNSSASIKLGTSKSHLLENKSGFFKTHPEMISMDA